MSERLRAALKGVEALAKDTAFEALIVGAADGLDKRVKERRALAEKMKTPAVLAALGSEEGAAASQLRELAEHVERDAKREANVAKWLRTLVGGGGRDALAAGSKPEANERGGE
jgi:GTPase